MTLIAIDIDFFDPLTIKSAGVIGTLPKQASFPPHAIPVRGDLIRFPRLAFQTGDPVFFRVIERTLVAESARAQLNLEMVAAFPYMLREEPGR